MGLFDRWSASKDKDAAALGEITRIRESDDPQPADVDRLYQFLRDARGRAVRGAAIQALRALQDASKDAPILTGAKLRGLDPAAEKSGAFRLYVLDVFGIAGKGTIATGIISSGTVAVGQRLILEKADGRDLSTRCVAVDRLDNRPIAPGVSVGVMLEGLAMGEVGQGDLLRDS